MKNLQRSIVALSLSLVSGLAVGCDADTRATDDLTAANAQILWPTMASDSEPMRAQELQAAVHGSAKHPHKPKHIKASDAQAAAWVQWVMALPYSTGPVNDPTGDSCAAGQGGKDWYLAGTSGGPAERDCDVPAGKHLVFPLINWWCVFFPELFPDEAAVDAAMPKYITAYQGVPDDVCSLTLKVDGQDVLADLDALNEVFNLTEQHFAVDLDDDHFAASSFAGGVMRAMTAGHYVRLKPLFAGDHVVEFGGAVCDDGQVIFETHVTYQLHVGP